MTKVINWLRLTKQAMILQFEFEGEKATLMNANGDKMSMTRDQALAEITRLKTEGWKLE